jgi:hypothetical protein
VTFHCSPVTVWLAVYVSYPGTASAYPESGYITSHGGQLLINSASFVDSTSLGLLLDPRIVLANQPSPDNVWLHRDPFCICVSAPGLPVR